MRRFVSTDWRAYMTVLLIILFFTAPLFFGAYKLGVHVRDHYSLPRTAERAFKNGDRPARKRAFGQEWGSANCGEHFERALHEDKWLLKELTESDEAAQEAFGQIRAARLRSCRELGYPD